MQISYLYNIAHQMCDRVFEMFSFSHYVLCIKENKSQFYQFKYPVYNIEKIMHSKNILLSLFIYIHHDQYRFIPNCMTLY